VRGNEAVDEANIYTGRSLKGEKPAEAPVMRPTRFRLVINVKTATALGPAVLSTPLAASN
jgi:putative ABC transport system substrate-binding protein